MRAYAYLAKSILQGAVNQFSLNWGECLRLFSTLPKSNFASALMQCIRSIHEQVEQASRHVVNWDILRHYFGLFCIVFICRFIKHKGICAPKKLLQYVQRWSELKELQRSFPVDNMLKIILLLWNMCSLTKLIFLIFILFHFNSIILKFACVPELPRPSCVVLVAALLPAAIWRHAYLMLWSVPDTWQGDEVTELR